MKAMRCLLGLICCLSLTTADVPKLRQLQEKSRFFELREALQEAGWNNPENLFYRALLESRFGQGPVVSPMSPPGRTNEGWRTQGDDFRTFLGDFVACLAPVRLAGGMPSSPI